EISKAVELVLPHLARAAGTVHEAHRRRAGARRDIRDLKAVDRCRAHEEPRYIMPGRRSAMRQGFRVIDSDTHVNPSLDVLLRYADAPLRDHLDELAPYTRKVKVQPGRGDAEDQTEMTILSIRQLRYQRVAGEKPSAPTDTGGDRGFLSGRTQMVTRKP